MQRKEIFIKIVPLQSVWALVKQKSPFLFLELVLVNGFYKGMMKKIHENPNFKAMKPQAHSD